MKNVLAILLVLGVSIPIAVYAQPSVNGDPNAAVIESLDSLLTAMQQLKSERNLLQFQIQQLNDNLAGIERMLDSHIDNTVYQQRTLYSELDTLRSLIPSEEPIRAANLNIIYLNRRQDSMMAYIGRLEDKIVKLPDNHYWGVRNEFKNFDHLLLFTFLGAMMSLGIVLLVKTGKHRDDDPQGSSRGDNNQDSDADRMSIAITLLVGSVLVVLFILFIL